MKVQDADRQGPFGKPTSTTKILDILKQLGVEKAKVKWVKGMFGSKQKVLVAPGFQMKPAGSSFPASVVILAANVHYGFGVVSQALDTDKTRALVDALKEKGIRTRLESDGHVWIGQATPPEQTRPDDVPWQDLVRRIVGREEPPAPEWMALTTEENIKRLKEHARGTAKKAVADLKSSLEKLQ